MQARKKFEGEKKLLEIAPKNLWHENLNFFLSGCSQFRVNKRDIIMVYVSSKFESNSIKALDCVLHKGKNSAVAETGRTRHKPIYLLGDRSTIILYFNSPPLQLGVRLERGGGARGVQTP